MNTPQSLDNPFWQFSLALYRSEQVQALCLELQDNHGADVNLLLWATWLETREQALSYEALLQAVELRRDWEREVVHPLRAIRRKLKQGHTWKQADVEPTRQAIKAVELQAEQLEQYWLYEHAESVDKGAADNVALYTQYLRLPGTCDWLTRWRRAVSAAGES